MLAVGWPPGLLALIAVLVPAAIVPAIIGAVMVSPKREMTACWMRWDVCGTTASVAP